MKKRILLPVLMVLITALTGAQTIDLTFPDGDEHFMNNTWSPHNITWESSGISSFKLEYSVNGGSDWILIEDNYSTSGYYSWDVPDLVSANCLIRITDAVGGTIFDESDAAFNIIPQGRYIAEWQTTMGQIRAELRGDLVPMTAQNFMNLSEKGFYTDLIFHRVISNFMIQDGCPYGNGYGGPGYDFDDEFDPELRHSHPGVLSMANAGPNTNGSQYFITVAVTSHLDDVHSVYGRIIDGMDVVYAISEVETNANDKPLVDIVLTIDIVESIPELNLVYPPEASKIEKGRELDIIWESDFIADSKIEFSSDNGANWTVLTDSIPSGEEIFPWTVPDISSSECIIKVTSLVNPSDFSQNTFEIRDKPAELNRIELYEGVNPPDNNPENMILAGKDLKFNVNILNLFSEELSSVNVNLLSHSDDLTVITGTVPLNNISIGEDEWSSESFEIQLPENVPGNGQYTFSLFGTASNVQDVFWLGDFNLPVLKKFPFITVDDDNEPDSNGNDDEILGPDEIIEIEIPIDNKGDEALFSVYGQLTTEAYFINIWNDVSGIDGTVYDTSAYNNGNPINPSTSGVNPMHDFVFDYNGDDIYITNFMLKVFGYLYEEAGASWDEGGILMKWGIPIVLNAAYPPAGIGELDQRANLFNIIQNPASDLILIEIDKTQNLKDAILEISNINGKIMYSEKLNFDMENLTVSTSGFTNGLYFVKISNTVKKVIILK